MYGLCRAIELGFWVERTEHQFGESTKVAVDGMKASVTEQIAGQALGTLSCLAGGVHHEERWPVGESQTCNFPPTPAPRSGALQPFLL